MRFKRFFKPVIGFINILALMSLGFGMGLLITEPIRVEAAGVYQRTITITSTATAQTNYQINFDLNTASLISGGKMRTDCGDIRLFDTNGTTLLDYYFEGPCNTSSSSIWVEVPSIPASSTKIIYLTYGDPLATSLSNGDNVFNRFEDFTTAPGCTLLNSATYDAVNDWIQLTPASNSLSGQCEYNYNPGTGFYAKFEYWSGGGNGADSVWLYAWNNATPIAEDIVPSSTRGYHFTVDEYEDRMCFTRSTSDNGPCLVSYSNSNLDNSQWREVEVFHSGVNTIMNLDGTQVLNGNDTNTRNKGSNRFGIAARTGGLNNIHRVRKILIGKYVPGITVSIGPEIGGVITLSFSIRNSTDTGAINTCDFGTVQVGTLDTCSYRLKIASSGTGYTVQVRTDGGLAAPDYTIIDAAVGTGGGGGTDISSSTVGTEAYGIVINPGSLSSGGSITRSNSYNAGSTNSVRLNTLVAQNMVTASGANIPNTTDTSRTILVTHNLNIAGDTPPGLFTQQITYTILPTF